MTYSSVLESQQTIAVQGRTFQPVHQVSIPEWPCVNAKPELTTLTLKGDDVFLVTDTTGNIPGCHDTEPDRRVGFFCQDTRFLSRLEVQVDGKPLVLLNSSAQQGFALSARCANPPLTRDGQFAVPGKTIAIQRDMALQGGLFEELTLTNFGNQAVTFELSLSFAADFADLFEIRGLKVRPRRGTLMQQVYLHTDPVDRAPEELVLAYQGVDESLMESHIQFYAHPPTQLSGHTAVWRVTLEPQETKVLGYRVQPFLNAHPASLVDMPANLAQAIERETQKQARWYKHTTRISTDNSSLNQTIQRAEQDIYLLQQSFKGGQALSAGIPWFSTLFGRDSIITALQTLSLSADIAAQTLRVLAAHQGQAVDPWRDEEPGKILHELRQGEMARCNEIPHTPYYGSVDATPLWLMLYADYYAWTGDRVLLDQLWANALAAMAWIDRHCQQAGGYLRYERKSSGGLRNQGWKDSKDCILDSQGRMAEGAIALSEVQGYVYAAKSRLAPLARLQHCPELADRWEQEAETLKARFAQDFWLPEQGYVALALDGEDRPVDSITSNPGHCLGLGILSQQQSQQVAERLMAPDMFSGWGIRTLSSASSAYNPMGYHVGAIWPHDNGMIAAGLRSQNHTTQALQVATDILDMTAQQPYHRPPELICGFDRGSSDYPVPYPVACSPQAWASGSIFQLLQTMLNLVPDASNNTLRIVQPALPGTINHMQVRNLTVGNTCFDLELERTDDRTTCRILNQQGTVNIVIET